MKKIGLVGGMGPESTLEYYRGIIDAFKDGKGQLNYPEILIYSVNLSEFLALMRAGAHEKVLTLLRSKLEALKNAGADFAALTANTPHLYIDQLQERSPLPLVSIVEATCNEAFIKGLKRPGLFGTGFTMAATFYQKVFSSREMKIELPHPDEREILNRKLFEEIEQGIFTSETRNLLVTIMERMVREQGIDSLILGCTEFPLILTEPEYAGIPMLNTTQIHVNAIVAYCLSDQ
jgi:aspartate racemase